MAKRMAVSKTSVGLQLRKHRIQDQNAETSRSFGLASTSAGLGGNLNDTLLVCSPVATDFCCMGHEKPSVNNLSVIGALHTITGYQHSFFRGHWYTWSPLP
jgi:hypothetical protein